MLVLILSGSNSTHTLVSHCFQMNQPSTVCRASAPAAQHGPKSVVSHNLLLCQVIIGGRFAIPPYGIFFLLANVAWRLSYLIYVCDLVWYGSIVLERKTMFF